MIFPNEGLSSEVVKSLPTKGKFMPMHPKLGVPLNKREMKQVQRSLKKVKKSYVPGKGYIPASKIPKAQLRNLARGDRRRGMIKEEAEARRHFNEYGEAMRQNRDFVRMLPEINKAPKPGRAGRNTIGASRMNSMEMMASTGSPVAGFALHTGGRKGTRTLVVNNKNDIPTIKHEMAHLTPKRDSYRLHRVLKDPVKLMREEARAEMRGGAYYANPNDPAKAYISAARHPSTQRRMNRMSPGQYTDETMDAFRGVQDKMHSANPNVGRGNNFRGNQWVDEKRRRRNIKMVAADTKRWAQDNPESAINTAFAGGVIAYGGAVIGREQYLKAKKKRQERAIHKSLDMSEGVSSLVSKMSPDPSELHVVGNSGQRRKGRLRKLPPDAVRRMS